MATAFLHEQPGFTPSPYAPTTYDGVLDVVAGAKAELEEQARERKARRWNPLYWLDSVVRFLLSIPAYVVSRVMGTSVARINKSAWGFPLRVLAVIADASAVYFGGRALGLWG
jgi:hypothetical protein